MTLTSSSPPPTAFTPADDPVLSALQPPMTATAILANVEAILPIVDEEAAATADQHHLTERMKTALRLAGVFRVGFAERRGGPEMSLTQQTRMAELIATRDAGIAWNAAILAATGFYAGRLGDEAFAELYPELDLPTCGSFHPRGRADVIDGGYRVTGRWKFGSGIRSSHHILGGVEVFDGGEKVLKEDGSALVLGVWLPTDEVEIQNDWETIGLRGSGSNGYDATDVFVPANHSFDRYFSPDADAEPLNKLVDLPFYSTAGIAVGIAQHAVDLASASLRARAGTAPIDTRRLGLLGEAESYLRAARAVVYQGVARIDESIFTPGELPSDSIMARGDAPVAADLARRIVDLCAELLGSQVVYTEGPFESLIRDLTAVAAHASTWRSRWVDVGKTLIEDVNR
jgi:alkylation response protein AidB-like acyl-CoA dehydrogenase